MAEIHEQRGDLKLMLQYNQSYLVAAKNEIDQSEQQRAYTQLGNAFFQLAEDESENCFLWASVWSARMRMHKRVLTTCPHKLYPLNIAR
jgi:hypothetical protein